VVRGEINILYVKKNHPLNIVTHTSLGAIMNKQNLTIGKHRDLSHNVYSVTSANSHTMLTRLNSLDKSEKARETFSDTVNMCLEFAALAMLFATFIILISLSDGFDQQMIAWLGR